ncbi:MAG: putative capsid protein [Cressdnaviricota sp.]|nr:MAG: putative capsid protein [Cressdnaviricota sp.]
MSLINQYNGARRLGMVGLARNIMNRYNTGRNQYYRTFTSRLGTSSRQRSNRSFTVQRRRNGIKSGQGVTTQQDRKFIYAKRRQPRFKRKRWGRFVKKVHAVAEKDYGTRTVVMNKIYSISNQISGLQANGAIYLYSQKGSTAAENAGDLNLIGTLENVAAPTAAAGITVWGSTKLLFQSAVLDVTIRNASTRIDTGPQTVYASEAKMEVDVYEMMVKRPTEEAGGTFNTFASLLNDNTTEIAPIGGAGTELVYNMRGATPFDTTFSLSRWGIRILKKTKYFIPNGDTITYQVRDPRRRVVTRDDCINQDGFNRPGWTRILWVVGKLVPGLTVGETVNTYQEWLLIGATRKYMYKVEGANDDRANYITT